MSIGQDRKGAAEYTFADKVAAGIYEDLEIDFTQADIS